MKNKGMSYNLKRFLSLLLAVWLLAGVLPATAAGEDQGTTPSPYEEYQRRLKFDTPSDFVLRGRYTWGMTADQVISKIEEEGLNFYDNREYAFLFDDANEIVAKGASLGAYPAELHFCFTYETERLFKITYYIPLDMGVNDLILADIQTSLLQKYGKEKAFGDNFVLDQSDTFISLFTTDKNILVKYEYHPRNSMANDI